VTQDPEIRCSTTADADEPTPISETKLEAMTVEQLQRSGIDPAHIYAYQQTGLLVTDENFPLLDDADIAEWSAAVERFNRLNHE